MPCDLPVATYLDLFFRCVIGEHLHYCSVHYLDHLVGRDDHLNNSIWPLRMLHIIGFVDHGKGA